MGTELEIIHIVEVHWLPGSWPPSTDEHTMSDLQSPDYEMHSQARIYIGHWRDVPHDRLL